MLGCWDDCPFACLVTDLAPIWDAFWMPWVTCGVTWDGPCKLVGAFGLDWLRQGTQLSHLAFVFRQKHGFMEICCILGPGCWQPVAACCNRVDPL